MTARRTKSGEELLALRRRRMASSPPVLRGGFRPLFLAAGVWAAASIALWIFALSGDVALPRGLDPLPWHRHEMVFGFGGAAVAGFLLTAIPNWTGRLPIAGAPLAVLVTIWVAARLGILLLPTILLPFGAALDIGLYVILSSFALREVVASGNRNLPISLLVLLFGGADALDHFSIAGILTDDLLGIRCGLGILMIMISVIGGRIIPSFTRNWMVKEGATGRLPDQPGRYDAATVAITAGALLLWIGFPSAKATGAALVLTALLQAIRLSHWRGWRTFKDPLLLILHIGYGWLVLGVLLLGVTVLLPDVPRTAAIHTIAVGAVATMILAVMTRASLGHTGRALRAALPTVIAYALLSLAALVRLATALGWIAYLPGLHMSSTLWVAAFLLFLIVYGPILWQPRVGE